MHFKISRQELARVVFLSLASVPVIIGLFYFVSQKDFLGTRPSLEAGVGDIFKLGSDRDIQPQPALVNPPQTIRDRKSTRLNSSHSAKSRMPSSA